MFVSFATEDRQAAESAVQALEANGHKCWVAWRDIPESVPYAAAIVQGIRGARVLLILLTPDSRCSPHVLREVECAVAANRPILSVQMAGCLPGEALAYYLGPTQWLRNDRTELDVGPLVAAVGKLAKDARSATKVGAGSQTLLALFRRALSFPVGILWATGFAMVTVTEVLALLQGDYGTVEKESFLVAQIGGAQHRSILLVLLGCFLSVGYVMEDAIERRRAPYNPLRGRSVPSYSLVAALFLIFGLWVWSLASGLSLAFLATGSSPGLKYPEGVGIPDFLSGFGSEFEFWWKIKTVFSYKPYGWDDELGALIVLLATAMVLGAVALCIMRLVRWPALALGIVAMLPFLLVRWFIDNAGSNDRPALLYWDGPIWAAVLSLCFRSVARSHLGKRAEASL